jgi:hypothetical protein
MNPPRAFYSLGEVKKEARIEMYLTQSAQLLPGETRLGRRVGMPCGELFRE